MKPQEQEDPAKGGEDWRGRFHEHFDEWMSVPEMHLLEDFIETEIERAKAEEKDLAKKRYLKIRDKVEAVFSIYLATFPAPRGALQKEIQDTIKDVVNTLKENVVGIVSIS